MKIKKIKAKDSQTALRKIKELLGNDASILSTKHLADGIEMVAANINELDNISKVNIKGNCDKDVIELMPAHTQELNDVKKELNSLKSLLQEQLTSLIWQDRKVNNPQQAVLISYLHDLGISANILVYLTESLDYQASSSLRTQIIDKCLHRLANLAKPRISVEGVCCVLGPSGHGKTLSLVKMAAQYVLRFGTDDLLLLCADSERVGSGAIMEAYAKLLNLPFSYVSDVKSYQQVRTRFSDRKCILLDTPPLENSNDFARIKLLLQQESQLQCYLTLDTTVNYSSLTNTIKDYSEFAITGFIFTKLDKCNKWGVTISLALEHNIPIHFIAEGQQVPEDLRKVTIQKYLDNVFADFLHNSCIDDAVKRDYSTAIMDEYELL